MHTKLLQTITQMMWLYVHVTCFVKVTYCVISLFFFFIFVPPSGTIFHLLFEWDGNVATILLIFVPIKILWQVLNWDFCTDDLTFYERMIWNISSHLSRNISICLVWLKKWTNLHITGLGCRKSTWFDFSCFQYFLPHIAIIWKGIS